MNYRILFISFLSFLMWQSLSAQDGPYSMAVMQPLYFNPANTGVHPAKLRVGGGYRMQWSSVHDAYRNYGVFADKKRKMLGMGIILNQNVCCDNIYRQSQMGISLALHKKLADGVNQLSAGVRLGFIQHRLDHSLLSFDQQYSSTLGFDPSVATGENLDMNRTISPDIHLGAAWNFQSFGEGNWSGRIGLGLAHFNTPNVSVFGEQVNYPMRLTAQAVINIEANEKMILHPQLVLMQQGNARFLQYGAEASFKMANQKRFRLGLGIRQDDALVLSTGIDSYKSSLSIAYDVNNSILERASNGRGALEVAAIFYFRDEKQPNIREIGGQPVPPFVQRDSASKTAAACAPCNNDMDKDGVLDHVDLCPYQPGELSLQGCSDMDKDGVWDHVDACPNIKGEKDNYGCPGYPMDLDSDGDGVKDKMDKCVYVKGDPALLGCPDADKDGISDVEDNCPYVRGAKHLMGCPESTAPQTVETLPMGLVEFDTDKDNVRMRYFAMLDEIAYTLNFNPNYRLHLEGHTDSDGDAHYNYNLSQRRAANVMAYLMERGVKPSQMESNYYGEVRPKTDNYSPNGKARNRRVELVLVTPR